MLSLGLLMTTYRCLSCLSIHKGKQWHWSEVPPRRLPLSQAEQDTDQSRRGQSSGIWGLQGLRATEMTQRAAVPSLKNQGACWTPEDIRKLRELAGRNTPTRIIALKLGRSEGAVRAKAEQLEVSLRAGSQIVHGTRRR